MRAKPFLTVADLSVELRRREGSRPILSGIGFDLAEREVLGIIGESGSGKSVLSRALVNWIRPPLYVTGGKVDHRGRDLLHLPDAEMQAIRGKEIGYIGSDPGSALDPTLSVGSQIVEKLRAVEPSISAAEARGRVIGMLEQVRIPSPEQRFDEFPFQYSGGMMQRALIVDAMVTRPAFLIADNVTQSLDVTIAAQILFLMRELRDRFGTAIIFISSSLAVVREIADHVIVLKDGEIVERSTPEGLIARPEHAYSRTLVERIPRIWDVEDRRRQAEPPAAAGSVLSVRDVYKTYRVRNPKRIFGHNEVKAVRGVSFDVMPGENFGIVGESGCGKSTLSRLLTWIEAPDSGQIFFEGNDVSGMSRRQIFALRSRFQLLLQDPYNSMPPHMPVGRTIAEPLLIHGSAGRKEVRERVLAVMGEVGLERELYGQLQVGLSAGQRQRISLARALVLEPDLLILDETLSSLDQVEQGRLLDLFERLQAQHNFTYIFISHDLAMVRRACTRIAVMYLGKVVELADNHTVFFDPGHPYTRALLSAVPTVEVRRYDPARCLLEGEPPSPVEIPPGCSFNTRCPLSFERCFQGEEPPLYERPSGVAACYWANTPLDQVEAEFAAGKVQRPVRAIAAQ
jgi:peptide/nickel transport system ATP-binding protein